VVLAGRDSCINSYVKSSMRREGEKVKVCWESDASTTAPFVLCLAPFVVFLVFVVFDCIVIFLHHHDDQTSSRHQRHLPDI
jgi:hypothetical protein